MKTFAIGDIHGAYRALLQVLERSKFDYKKDKLIILGDVVDGWPETPEVIEELMKIKNRVFVMGNHDYWAYRWLETGAREQLWDVQGGQATIDAYVQRHGDLMAKHRDEFFKPAPFYYVDEKNRVFCHGGFRRGIQLEIQTPEKFMWDRSLAEKAVNSYKDPHFRVKEFAHVFLGHTTVNSFKAKQVEKDKPFTGGNITLLDTGAGWEGVLTIMDIDTMEYFQSDQVTQLYPEAVGRKWYAV